MGGKRCKSMEWEMTRHEDDPSHWELKMSRELKMTL
jgi:hypothetical protein